MLVQASVFDCSPLCYVSETCFQPLPPEDKVIGWIERAILILKLTSIFIIPPVLPSSASLGLCCLDWPLFNASFSPLDTVDRVLTRGPKYISLIYKGFTNQYENQ